MLDRRDLVDSPGSLYLTKKFFEPAVQENVPVERFLNNEILTVIKLRLITLAAIEALQTRVEKNEIAEVNLVEEIYVPLDEEKIAAEKAEKFNQETQVLINKHCEQLGLNKSQEIPDIVIEDEIEQRFMENLKDHVSTGNVVKEFYTEINESITDILADANQTAEEKREAIIEFLDIYGSDPQFDFPEIDDGYLDDRIKISILKRMSAPENGLINLNSISPISINASTNVYSLTNEGMDFNYVVTRGKRQPLAVYIMNLQGSEQKLDLLVNTPEQLRNLLLLLPKEKRADVLNRLFSTDHLNMIIENEAQKEFILDIIPRDTRSAVPQFFKSVLPGALKLDERLTDNFFKAVTREPIELDITLPTSPETLADFLNSEDGKKYLKTVERLISGIKEWGAKNNISSGFKLENMDRLYTKFANYSGGNREANVTKFPMYREVPHLLQGILNLLNKDSLPDVKGISKADLAKRQDIYANMLLAVTVCEPGLATKLDTEVYSKLTANVAESLMQVRHELAANGILDTMRKAKVIDAHNRGSEVHYINAVMNYYAFELGVNKKEDNFMPRLQDLKRELGNYKSSFDFFNNEIETGLTLPAIINYIINFKIPDIAEMMKGVNNENYSDKIASLKFSLDIFGSDDKFNIEHIFDPEKMAMEGVFELESNNYIHWQLFSSMLTRLENSGFVDANTIKKQKINDFEIVIPDQDLQYAYLLKPDGQRTALYAYIEKAHVLDFEEKDSFENLKNILAALSEQIGNDVPSRNKFLKNLSDQGRENLVKCDPKFVYQTDLTNSAEFSVAFNNGDAAKKIALIDDFKKAFSTNFAEKSESLKSFIGLVSKDASFKDAYIELVINNSASIQYPAIFLAALRNSNESQRVDLMATFKNYFADDFIKKSNLLKTYKILMITKDEKKLFLDAIVDNENLPADPELYASVIMATDKTTIVNNFKNFFKTDVSERLKFLENYTKGVLFNYYPALRQAFLEITLGFDILPQNYNVFKKAYELADGVQKNSLINKFKEFFKTDFADKFDYFKPFAEFANANKPFGLIFTEVLVNSDMCANDPKMFARALINADDSQKIIMARKFNEFFQTNIAEKIDTLKIYANFAINNVEIAKIITKVMVNSDICVENAEYFFNTLKTADTDQKTILFKKFTEHFSTDFPGKERLLTQYKSLGKNNTDFEKAYAGIIDINNLVGKPDEFVIALRYADENKKIAMHEKFIEYFQNQANTRETFLKYGKLVKTNPALGEMFTKVIIAAGLGKSSPKEFLHLVPTLDQQTLTDLGVDDAKLKEIIMGEHYEYRRETSEVLLATLAKSDYDFSPWINNFDDLDRFQGVIDSKLLQKLLSDSKFFEKTMGIFFEEMEKAGANHYYRIPHFFKHNLEQMGNNTAGIDHYQNFETTYRSLNTAAEKFACLMKIITSPPGAYHAGTYIAGVEIKKYPLSNVVDLIEDPRIKLLFIKQVMGTQSLDLGFVRSLMPNYDSLNNIYAQMADDKDVNHRFDKYLLEKYIPEFLDKYSNIDKSYQFGKNEFRLFEKMIDVVMLQTASSLPPAIKAYADFAEGKKKFLHDFDEKFKQQVMDMTEQVNSSEGDVKINKKAKLDALQAIRQEIYKYSIDENYSFDDLVQKAAAISIQTTQIKHVGLFSSTFGGKSKTDALISEFVEKAKKFNVEPQAQASPASPTPRK